MEGSSLEDDRNVRSLLLMITASNSLIQFQEITYDMYLF